MGAMAKLILVLMDACRFDAITQTAGYLEHMIDYGKGAKYRIRGELPSMSRPMYETLMTGLPVWRHGHRQQRCAEAFPLSQSFFSLPGAWFGYSCCGLCLV